MLQIRHVANKFDQKKKQMFREICNDKTNVSADILLIFGTI